MKNEFVPADGLSGSGGALDAATEVDAAPGLSLSLNASNKSDSRRPLDFSTRYPALAGAADAYHAVIFAVTVTDVSVGETDLTRTSYS